MRYNGLATLVASSFCRGIDYRRASRNARLGLNPLNILNVFLLGALLSAALLVGISSARAQSSIRFAVIGDYGVDTTRERDVANMVKSWNPSFVITVGDNNYENGASTTIDKNIGKYYHSFIFPYTGTYGSGATTNRFFPSLGNHDWITTGAKPYLDYFRLPNNERYYDFVRGPVHFFVIDSDSHEPSGRSSTSTQAKWLKGRLAASTARWKLVYFHHPPYSSGEHGSNKTMQWPFKLWGATAVLAGHDHDYERIIVQSFPYFVNGLGGAERRYFGTPIPGSKVRYKSNYGAMLVEASSTKINFRFISRGGRLVDNYTITYSSTVATVTNSVPVEQISLVAAAGSDSQITLSWTDNATDEDGYKIERCQGQGCTDFTQVAEVGPGVATYNDTGRTAGTTYLYRIRAFNAGGDSQYSNTATATTLASTTASTTLRFSQEGYSVNEGSATVTVTAVRDGNTAQPATVEYATPDTASVPCAIVQGVASQNCDYTISSGTLYFAPGETAKTFKVIITDDAYVEGPETFQIRLSNPSAGATLSSLSTATVTIVDNDNTAPASNPSDDAQYFVRQHYYDLLSREPDQADLDDLAKQITSCGNDQACIRSKRITVSNTLFSSPEYQQTGSYVFRLYRAGYGSNQPFPNPDTSNQIESRKLPSYAVFSLDRARVVGGADLAQSQLNLARQFVERPEFIARYPLAQDGNMFITAILDGIRTDTGADLTSQFNALVELYNSAGSQAEGRAVVLYRLADDNAKTNPINNRAFVDAEYNRAFVTTRYFGYLRRDADGAELKFWLEKLNDSPVRNVRAQKAMVCSFIKSVEYQSRFSSVVTQSNKECP